MIIYYVILAISVILNILACTYSVYAARKLLVVDSNIDDIQEIFVSFQAHVESLYETEMFYGDESLKSLIDHSKLVLDEVDKYENMYMLVLDEGAEGLEEITEEENIG